MADDGLRRGRLAVEEVAEDDDRVLEALGAVDGDELDLGAGLVADRGVAFLGAALGLLLEVADQGAEGRGAGGLVGPGDVEGLPEVRHPLVALGAEPVGGEGARLLEELDDDVARGADAAQAMQAGQEVEGGFVSLSAPRASSGTGAW